MFKKINTSDAKDRLYHVHQTQGNLITEVVHEIIEQDPFMGIPFYIFSHKRTVSLDERIHILSRSPHYQRIEEVPDIKIIWQTRLTKPQAQENSMLFKVNPLEPENVKIIWIIPEKEKFDLYKKDKFFECQIVAESIYNYIHNKKILEKKEEGDLDDESIRNIYKNIRLKSQNEKVKAITSSIL